MAPSSPKFNAKTLHYDKSEPDFLRRLRGEQVGSVGGDPDRHNVQHARPQKARLGTGAGEDDDGPTIVDEMGEGVSMEEWEVMQRRAGGEGEGKGDGEGDGDPEGNKNGDGKLERQGKGQVEEGFNSGEEVEGRQAQSQIVAEIGSGSRLKKRKVGKVVSGEDEVEGRGEELGEEHATTTPTSKAKPSPTDDAAKPTVNKPSKKVKKKVKLSFDEPDG